MTQVLNYYRQYDKYAERLDIANAKLLLIQDKNKIHTYKKKGLAEIDLPQLRDLDSQGKGSKKHIRPRKFTIWTLSGVYSRGKVIKGAKDSHVHFVSNFWAFRTVSTKQYYHEVILKLMYWWFVIIFRACCHSTRYGNRQGRRPCRLRILGWSLGWSGWFC